VFGEADWGAGPRLTVRVGLHLGSAEERDGNFFGPPVNQAARVMQSAHGGQCLMTDVVRDAISAPSVDLGRHLLRDIDTPVHLYQLGVAAFPPLANRTIGASSLPSPRTSLIGRRKDVQEVRRLVDTHRLVTLTGVGGCGKTRLAIEVAHRQAPLYPDGIWFVDLSPVSDPEALLGPFVGTFALSLPVGAAPQQEIAAYLAPRSALLVIDNCEHVIDAIATFVDELLERCPLLTVLTTSREALAIDGEYTWHVPSLATGAASPAVQLFIERATAVGTIVGRDDPTLRTISEIVARLDGIPLAVELAAAITRTLDIGEIRSRLDDPFSLLTGGTTRGRGGTVTLEGAVRWSYDLLSEAEQRMLRSLSVFHGGFDLDDAVALSGAPAPEARRLVAALVAKSLVDVSRGDDAHLRHRLLDTIRLFALARLADAGDAERLRDQHMTHFAGDPVARTYDAWASYAGIERIWREYENFRAAGARAITRGKPVVAARIASVLSDASVMRGEADTMIEWMRRPGPLEPGDRLIIRSFLGWVLLLQFDTDEAILALDDAITAGEHCDSDFLVGALLYRGLWASIRGEVELDRDSIDAASRLADERFGGNACGTTAVARSARLATKFRYDEIVEVCDACIDAAPRYGYRHIIESFRAWALLRSGRIDAAAAAVAAFSPIPRGSRWEIMNLSAEAVVSAHTEGAEPAARRLAQVASELVARRPEMDQEVLECFAYFALMRGERDRANELVDSVVTAGGLGIGHWVRFSELGMNVENADQVMAEFHAANPLEARLAARDAHRARLLGEELARWSPGH
jgi:predicted ATPase